MWTKLEGVQKSPFSYFKHHVLFPVNRNDINVVKRDFAVFVLVLRIFVLEVTYYEMCIIGFQVMKDDWN